jgi:hypothetical protein
MSDFLTFLLDKLATLLIAVLVPFLLPVIKNWWEKKKKVTKKQAAHPLYMHTWLIVIVLELFILIVFAGWFLFGPAPQSTLSKNELRVNEWRTELRQLQILYNTVDHTDPWHRNPVPNDRQTLDEIIDQASLISIQAERIPKLELATGQQLLRGYIIAWASLLAAEVKSQPADRIEDLNRAATNIADCRGIIKDLEEKPNKNTYDSQLIDWIDEQKLKSMLDCLNVWQRAISAIVDFTVTEAERNEVQGLYDDLDQAFKTDYSMLHNPSMKILGIY